MASVFWSFDRNTLDTQWVGWYGPHNTTGTTKLLLTIFGRFSLSCTLFRMTKLESLQFLCVTDYSVWQKVNCFEDKIWMTKTYSVIKINNKTQESLFKWVISSIHFAVIYETWIFIRSLHVWVCIHKEITFCWKIFTSKFYDFSLLHSFYFQNIDICKINQPFFRSNHVILTFGNVKQECSKADTTFGATVLEYFVNKYLLELSYNGIPDWSSMYSFMCTGMDDRL